MHSSNEKGWDDRGGGESSAGPKGMSLNVYSAIRVTSPCYSVSKDDTEDSKLFVCFLLFGILCVYFFFYHFGSTIGS